MIDVQAKTDYETELFDRFSELRKNNFFYRGRLRIINRLVRKPFDNMLLERPGAKIADIGFGHGTNISHRLIEKSALFGIDINLNTLSRIKCSGARATLVNADLRELPFKEAFDVVIMLDVLEHVQDDVKALERVREACKEGALLVMTVPATPSMYGAFDKLAHHHRRYSMGDIKRKLEGSGFTIEKISYFIFFLFPFIYMFRKLREAFKRRADSGSGGIGDMAEVKTIPIVNSLCLATLSAECAIIPAFDLPFGSSIVAIARKR